MEQSILEIAAAAVGALPLGYFIGRSKMKAEVSKLIAETKSITDNHEITLANFYREQVLELMENVKSLKADMVRCEECYETIEKLKEDYKHLQQEVTILKNK